MFHVEQKEPGAGNRQGTDREQKKKLDRNKWDRLGWSRSLDAFN